MHITLKWLDENESIILIDAQKGWTWEEMFHTAMQARELVESKSHTVDSVYNFNNTPVPLNTSLLAQMNHLTRKVPANSGKIYIVQAMAFGIKIVEIFVRITPAWSDKIGIVKSLDDALADIQKRKATVV
jgi:hypothetical protein